jgi:hypothetical protein
VSEWKPGDEVSWAHYMRHGVKRAQGFIHQIADDKARLRMGPKGKRDYWVPLSALHPASGNPMAENMTAIRQGMIDRGEVNGRK